MTATFGAQSMVDPMRTVLVRKPDASFATANPKAWGYTSRPDLNAARKEHEALVGQLRASGVEVWYHDEPLDDKADAIFVHDPVIVTDRGAIVLRMGKELRRGEEASIGKSLGRHGVPILGTLRTPATAEGGDLLWVTHDLLAVGQGYRTNPEGRKQLQELLKGSGVRTEAVPLPAYKGPEVCLHLMSLVSLVAEDLAVIYPRLLPPAFRVSLRKNGFDFVEVPDAEFDRMAPNVLAVRPKDCIMLEGNPITQGRLESAGCRVRTYRGNEISLKAEGGATCLTRPVLRRA
jgi:dimethylargininase